MEKYNKIKSYVTKNSISYSIIKLDSSMSIDDVVQEVYLKLYDKDDNFIHNKVNQTLINIYNKLKNKKIEVVSIEDNYDKLNVDEYSDSIILSDILNNIRNIVDESDYNYTYDYFVVGKTYRDIGEKYNVPYRTVKNRIDKTLKLLREYYNK